jgi:hypothetical protein
MKRVFIAITIIILIGLMACSQKQKDNTADELKVKNSSPIDGNWVTVSFEQNGKLFKPKRFPQQMKMFHDGYFSMIAYDTTGNFSYAGAGHFEINGNMYKESVDFHSTTDFINYKDWEKWEMKGDTLICYGFEKVEMPDGKDVTKEWSANGKFIEKRVRVK